MADEVFSPDANFKAGGLVGGVSSVNGRDKLILRINPVTNRLLVDAAVTVTGLATAIADGDAINVANVGTMVLGHDGSNYQTLSTNSSGRLQVDIVTSSLALESGGNLAGLNAKFSSAGALSDSFANPTTTQVGAMTMGFDGINWMRIQNMNHGDTIFGDNRALRVGTQTMMYNGSTWDRMRGDLTNGVLVNLGSNNDVSLNAGTNAIGKLTANGGVIIGDVNLIASQTGISAGAGAVAANTPRVTHASDDPQTTSLQLIDDIILASDAAAGSAKGALILGQFVSSPVKVSTSGDAVALSLTQDGRALKLTESNDSFVLNNNYSSAQTNTSQQSAPGASKRLVVTKIVYSRDTAGNMKLVEDPAGTPATKFGPHYFPATGGMVAVDVYIPLTTNKALGLTSVGGGNETFSCYGITENV